MATAPSDCAPIPFPGAIPPMPAVARILARFDREQVEGFIAVALDLLDTLDRPFDPDEPDFTPRVDGKAGDPEDGEAVGDEGDFAWSEWHHRNATGRQAGVEANPLENCGRSEDDEDDDPAGQMDEDGINTGQAVFCLHGIAQTGPGCILSDDDVGERGTVRLVYGEDQTQAPINYEGKFI